MDDILKELKEKKFFDKLQELVDKKGCDSKSTFMKARKVLLDMGYGLKQVENFITYFEDRECVCDCMILKNFVNGDY